METINQKRYGIAFNKWLIKNRRTAEVIISILLFTIFYLSGFGRYRFVLVLIAYNLLRALNQYTIDLRSKFKISPFWDVIQIVSGISLIIAFIFDINKGQISPIYLDLPLWKTILLAGFIILGLIPFFKSIFWIYVQKISADKIFSVCPNCGIAWRDFVEVCKNCNYGGINFQQITNVHSGNYPSISGDLLKEKESYPKINHPISASMRKGLSLDPDETVLISLKARHFTKISTVLKNGERSVFNKYNKCAILNRFILTNKKICFLATDIFLSGGWIEKYCYSYSDIDSVFIEPISNDFLSDNSDLIIKAKTDEYKLKGFFHPTKMFENVISCIRKRNPNV